LTLPISSLPKGLVALLGSKGLGESPRELADQVVGTVDLTQMYLLNDREFATGTNAAPAVGGNVFTQLIVPTGEVWYVHMYGIDTTPGAGAAIDVAPGWRVGALSGILSTGNYVSAAATQNARPFTPAPFLANSGSQFGFNVRSVTLAPQVDCLVVFTRLRA
jgi:hypothetical protein